jgi:hypothetical protein
LSDNAYFITAIEIADWKLACRKVLRGERAKTEIAPPARATFIQEKPPAVSCRGSILKPFSSFWDEPDQKLR